ncbi:hypothetical protein BH10PAT3_BH10PAT3_7770 [soil metagenome]
MKRETIAVDVDEVLFPMAPTFLTYHNDTHGTSFTTDEMTSYYVEELTGETEAQMLAKIDAYLETEHYTAGLPVEGSVESIKKLRERYRLVLITARQSSYRGSTEAFIGKHFEGLFDDLRYTHNLEAPEIYIPKSGICKELGASALIDDSLSNVKDCAAQGIRSVLFGSYTWNQTTELPEGVTRCADWPAVLEHFSGRG